MGFRPRFSLRSLFAAITLLAVLLSWIAWNRQLAMARTNLLRWCDQNGVGYIADRDMHEAGVNDAAHGGLYTIANTEPMLFIRRWFGDRNVHWFVADDIPSAKRGEFDSLFPEALFLDGVPLSHNRPITGPDGAVRKPTFIPH
jgi:hypothetical protein